MSPKTDPPSHSVERKSNQANERNAALGARKHSVLTETELDDLLSCPSPALVDFIRSVSSPLVVLGAGGKMGPTLAVMAKRAAEKAGHALEVVAVSRFTNQTTKRWLEAQGICTISADLLDRGEYEGIPDAANVLYLAGIKFGTSQKPSLTWATNTIVPMHVMDRFRAARIVALSTGNVYPLMPVNSGGARETTPLTPVGEYGNAAVARERVFEYFSEKFGVPMVLLRLSYAVELRYGVLTDIAQKVFDSEPVDLSNGSFHCIWQGDANDLAIRSLKLAHAPPLALNFSGPEPLSVRATALRFAELFGKTARFSGSESGTALLSNMSRMIEMLGSPATPMDLVMNFVADWVKRGGRSLNKPTHFEVRDGAY